MSPSMEEFMRTAASPQPQQLTPDALPRADVITAGRKQARSPAKLRSVGGEEEAEKEDETMQLNGEEGEVEETARVAVSPTQTFTPKGQRGGSPVLGEDEVEEAVFIGGLNSEGGGGGGGGGGAAEGGAERADEDGLGGNETPHAPTEAWSDAGAPMEEEGVGKEEAKEASTPGNGYHRQEEDEEAKEATTSRHYYDFQEQEEEAKEATTSRKDYYRLEEAKEAKEASTWNHVYYHRPTNSSWVDLELVGVV